MSQTPESLITTLRAGIEQNRLPLTVISAGGALVVAAVRNRSLAAWGEPDEIFNTLVMASVYPDGRVALEDHMQQWGLEEGGIYVERACINTCGGYRIEDGSVVHMRPNGLEYSRSEVADMFDPENRPHTYLARRAGTDIERLHDRLATAEPIDDVFAPQNGLARQHAMETLIEHRVLDLACRAALEQLDA